MWISDQIFLYYLLIYLKQPKKKKITHTREGPADPHYCVPRSIRLLSDNLTFLRQIKVSLVCKMSCGTTPPEINIYELIIHDCYIYIYIFMY